MMGYTHAMIAILIARAIGLVSLSSYYELAYLIVIAMLPDIDQPKGILSFITRPVSYLIHAFYGHRSITHSLVTLALGTALSFILNIKVGLLFAIAYGSHILFDMLTYSGVMLFFPNRKHFTLLDGPFRTGEWTELLLCSLSIGGIILLEVLG